MKCDSCIHKQVCKDKPPESYPQFMVNIMTDKCENYIHNAYVQPVKHAKWVYSRLIGFKCSNCAEPSRSKPYRAQEKFCPNCGAKMDKK